MPLVYFERACVVKARHLVVIDKTAQQDRTVPPSLLSLDQVYYLNHLPQSFLSSLELVDRSKQYAEVAF
jgi:hypothetical protein